ncbi:MAG: bifunctional [glutamine synthetase] adenylyltransferase/[glutamine synthetase]-adenylyl-L-tyrosine phosphorylase, partial [Rhodospirillales bacterium]|nr:bifunctional [glutamine synthetase] adenylyltransferase/[glutamine synthetase]-adenylyl-L-tyrosine phosphorylase [Rhodospirillales bacterium]
MHQFSYASQIDVIPRPASEERGRVGGERWIEAAESADIQGLIDRSRTLLQDPACAKLAQAVFGNSPYLGQCAVRDPDIMAHILESGPDQVLAGICRKLISEAADVTDEASIKRYLRTVKRQAALTIGVADIAELWTAERVTSALSEFADLCVTAALQFLLRRLADKGTVELPNLLNPEEGSGIIILALGKLGSAELNYSSDIDLIIFFDPDVIVTESPDRLQQNFSRLAREFVNLLSDRTEDGYVFRTDLRLRPDPASTPPAISVRAAEAYYESIGQNWERAALIKARQIAGDRTAGDHLLNILQPFIWRKNLDFAAIDDIHSIKRQINAHRGGSEIAIDGHNIKLGRGGIREVEFFAQTQQLIWGGRMPELREKSTSGALRILAQEQLISPEAVSEMIQSYWYLRKVENRLQMIDDQQTHELPDSPDALDALAIFLNYSDTDAFRTDMLFHLKQVESHYAALFEEAPDLSTGELDRGNLIFTGAEEDPDTLQTLKNLGFQEPKAVAGRVRSWHHGRARATRTERARQILTELMPALLAAFGATSDPDAAFVRFDDFLTRLPSGIQLFSMFHANPKLLELVAEIMGGAPKLAEHLERNPSALEGVLSADFYDTPPALDAMILELDTALERSVDFEDMLNICRRWNNDRKLQVGVQLLRHLIDWENAGRTLSDIAQAAITQISKRVAEEFKATHGTVPGSQWAIAALGKLGGREMTPASDLDLIFIYDHG